MPDKRATAPLLKPGWGDGVCDLKLRFCMVNDVSNRIEFDLSLLSSIFID